MHATDRDEFFALLDTHAATFRQPKLDDVKAQAYWRALRDLPLSVIQQASDTHLRFGKFFPKPVELRPRDDKPPSTMTPLQEGAIKASVAESERTWADLQRQDPERYAYERGMAVAARAMATTEPHSPIYAQALAEYRHYADQRRAAWERARGRA